MKRVKLKVSVANFDGYTYSPGDVMEMSDEDAEYIIATGQGTETTDQVTDVAAREAAEGEHAIQVDIQHGDAPEIVIVADDGDKTSAQCLRAAMTPTPRRQTTLAVTLLTPLTLGLLLTLHRS